MAEGTLEEWQEEGKLEDGKEAAARGEGVREELGVAAEELGAEDRAEAKAAAEATANALKGPPPSGEHAAGTRRVQGEADRARSARGRRPVKGGVIEQDSTTGLEETKDKVPVRVEARAEQVTTEVALNCHGGGAGG